MAVLHSTYKKGRYDDYPAFPTLVFLVVQFYCALLQCHAVGTRWCDLDTGLQTIEDGNGRPHSVYISVTRDGSVWVRVGKDHTDLDWSYTQTRDHMFTDNLLEGQMVEMLDSLNYSDYCVLTDVNLVLKAEGAWHPSFLTVYYPGSKTKTKRSRILIFRHNKDCYTETNITLSQNKQGLICDGGRTNVCGMRNLPEKGHRSNTLFLKTVKFDLKLDEQTKGTCASFRHRNYFTFTGSYYHAYVKMASCPPPKDARILGYEAKLRSRRDREDINNTAIIPDPLQRALASAVIKGWQIFVKIISPQHEVYLQVWRPSPHYDNTFTLVGQSYFHPQELRFHEVPLQREDMIHIKKGDVLGIYFPKQNPIGWSSAPCAGDSQNFRTLTHPKGTKVGKAYTFRHPGPDEEAHCRHYSFTAIFANKTDAKLVEDWICPTATLRMDTRKRSGSMSDRPKKNRNGPSTKPPEVYTLERRHSSDGTIPVHLILIIIGCLLVLLMIVGFISYYKAIKS